MKRTLDISAYVLFSVALAAGSCSLGYYRGVCDCSVKAASFQLATDEAIYEELHMNRLDVANRSLKVFITGDSKTLGTLKDDPLSYFEYEVFTAKAGDIPKQLQKADEILKDKSSQP